MPHALFLALIVAAPAPTLPNLDFGRGRLTFWEGMGFYVTTGSASGPSLACGVCSSDGPWQGRTAVLYRTFLVPAGAGTIRFSAAAVRPEGCKAEGTLEVTLEA